MAMVELNDSNFQVETSQGTVLVDFWAPWCGPCQMIAHVLVDIENELGDSLKIGKLNVDHNPQTSAKYGVMSIPTLLLFKDGQVTETIIGYQPKAALLEKLRKHL